MPVVNPHTAAASLVLVAACLLTPPAALAQDSGSLLLRTRITHLDSVNGDSTGLKLSVNNKTYGSIDASWFLGPNVAGELSVSSAQRHTLYASGSPIGSLRQTPVTLSLQYHYTGLAGWRPYVGLGIHYTRLSSVSFDPTVVAALGPDIERSSTGLAAQLGADVALGSGWLMNVDARKVQMRTDVSSFGSKVGTFKIDPVLLSVGLGYRF
jgi:outer membrane protein